MTVDKFAWIRAVQADKRLTPGERLLLSHAAIFDVLRGGETFCVRQSTLARNCGMTRKTAGEAIMSGKRLGYLTVARRHKPGPGGNRGDELRLTLPESCVDTTHHSDEQW